jgi:hypothetical protein
MTTIAVTVIRQRTSGQKITIDQAMRHWVEGNGANGGDKKRMKVAEEDRMGVEIDETKQRHAWLAHHA